MLQIIGGYYATITGLHDGSDIRDAHPNVRRISLIPSNNLLEFVMTTHGPDFDALTALLENLEVEVSRTPDGVFTACSENEPRFCFDGYSQQEVVKTVSEAIESYARLFLGFETLTLNTNRQDVQEPTVKVESPRPLSRLTLEVA